MPCPGHATVTRSPWISGALRLCGTSVPLGTCWWHFPWHLEPLVGPSQKTRPSDPNPASHTNRPFSCVARANLCRMWQPRWETEQGPQPPGRPQPFRAHASRVGIQEMRHVQRSVCSGGLLAPTQGSPGLRVSRQGSQAAQTDGRGTGDPLCLQSPPEEAGRSSAQRNKVPRGVLTCLTSAGPHKPIPLCAPHLRQRQRPRVQQKRGARCSWDLALESGVDKGHQVLQLFLQALLIPMVLNDPIEGPKVVQATL